MRERFGDHVAPSALLLRVVTHRGGGAQRRGHIALLENVLGFVGVLRPNAGIAVGLQLQFHRQLVCLRLRSLLLRSVHPGGDAEQVLHVMAHFVREHIRLGEQTGRLELVRELLIEIQIEIHLAVGRTIERAGG